MFNLLVFILNIILIYSKCEIKNKTNEIIKNKLEKLYSLNSLSLSTSPSSLSSSSNSQSLTSSSISSSSNSLTPSQSSITMLFGHLHHAGGTSVCELARNNIQTNLKSNCNHPNEFSKKIPPTRGTITEQLLFQKQTNWKFYAVELSMPQDLLFEGPFIYSIIIRHPYLLLLSQYRRSKTKFQFQGTLKDLVKYQFSRVNSSFDLNKISTSNYYRGIAGFILGKYQETFHTNDEIFQEVVERLERFSVILLTEELSTTGQIFKLKFNWNTTKFGENLVNSHGNISELLTMANNLSIDDKKFVKWYCQIDLLIYQYSRCLINEELTKYSHLNIKLLKKYSKDLIEMEKIFLLE